MSSSPSSLRSREMWNRSAPNPDSGGVPAHVCSSNQSPVRTSPARKANSASSERRSVEPSGRAVPALSTTSTGPSSRTTTMPLPPNLQARLVPPRQRSSRRTMALDAAPDCPRPALMFEGSTREVSDACSVTDPGLRSATLPVERSAAFTRHQTVGVVDRVDLLDGAQHRVEMAGIGELELEPHLRNAVATGVRAARHDVDVLLAERVGDVAQQTRAIEGDHFDARPEDGLRAVAVPIDVDQPRRLVAHQALGVGAVRAMHRHATAACDEADDVVAGNGRATSRQSDEDVVEALDMDTDGRTWAMRSVRASGRDDRELLAICTLRERPRDSLSDRPRRHVVLTDRRQHRIEVGVGSRGDLVGQHLAVPDALQRKTLAAELLGELLAAGFDHVDTSLATEPLTDLVARSR